MCPRCGDRADAIQHDWPRRPHICPSCGGDLYARPPRSYAEMEGLEPDARAMRHAARWLVPILSAARAIRRAVTMRA
mgnify:CR=1 FL=1